ncbi:hypothetical protein, partial [uncultured Roseibium sp.]
IPVYGENRGEDGTYKELASQRQQTISSNRSRSQQQRHDGIGPSGERSEQSFEELINELHQSPGPHDPSFHVNSESSESFDFTNQDVSLSDPVAKYINILDETNPAPQDWQSDDRSMPDLGMEQTGISQEQQVSTDVPASNIQRLQETLSSQNTPNSPLYDPLAELIDGGEIPVRGDEFFDELHQSAGLGPYDSSFQVNSESFDFTDQDVSLSDPVAKYINILDETNPAPQDWQSDDRSMPDLGMEQTGISQEQQVSTDVPTSNTKPLQETLSSQNTPNSPLYDPLEELIDGGEIPVRGDEFFDELHQSAGLGPYDSSFQVNSESFDFTDQDVSLSDPVAKYINILDETNPAPQDRQSDDRSMPDLGMEQTGISQEQQVSTDVPASNIKRLQETLSSQNTPNSPLYDPLEEPTNKRPRLDERDRTDGRGR